MTTAIGEEILHQNTMFFFASAHLQWPVSSLIYEKVHAANCSSCSYVYPIFGLKVMETLYFRPNLVVYSIYGAKVGQMKMLVHKYNEINFYTTALFCRLPPSFLFEVTGSRPSGGRSELSVISRPDQRNCHYPVLAKLFFSFHSFFPSPSPPLGANVSRGKNKAV